MKNAVGLLSLIVVLFSQSSAALAGYKITAPEIAPLSLYERAKAIDMVFQLTAKEEALKSIVKISSNGNYEEYALKTAPLYKILHSFESSVASVLPTLRTALENGEALISQKYTDQKIHEAYNLLHHEVETEEELTFIRENFPTLNLSQAEWEKVAVIQKTILEQIAKKKDSEGSSSNSSLDEIAESFADASFLKDMRTAVQLIENHVQDGDTVVAVGNTPQYILSALKHSKKNLELLTVAISGWPGIHKAGVVGTWYADLVTPTGLNNYRKYLHDAGFLSEKPRKRVFFLDIIGGGGGVEFLIHQLRHYSQAHGQTEPDINVIAINDIGNKMKGRSIEVDAYSLGLNSLAQKLDRMRADLRVTIGLNGWKWDKWLKNPLLLPSTEGAKKVIQIIDTEFTRLASPALLDTTPSAPVGNLAEQPLSHVTAQQGADSVTERTVILVDRPDLKVTKTTGSLVHLGNTYDVKIKGYEALSKGDVFSILKTCIPGIGQEDELFYESGTLVMNLTRHKSLGANMTKEEHESCFYSVGP